MLATVVIVLVVVVGFLVVEVIGLNDHRKRDLDRVRYMQCQIDELEDITGVADRWREWR